MNNTLLHVTEILTSGSWTSSENDCVTLDYEDRFRRRMVLTSQHGLRFLLELPQPQLLNDGDGLKLSDDRVITVQAASESLVEIRCDNLHHLMRVAWHLGNRHLPTQIFEDYLLIRDDHVIVDMVQGLGGQISKIVAPFTPEGGAYGHGAVHGHEHGHSHNHDHHSHSHSHSDSGSHTHSHSHE